MIYGEFLRQGDGMRHPNYRLVGENCILVGENYFDLPNLVGEIFSLLIHLAENTLKTKYKMNLVGENSDLVGENGFDLPIW